MAETLTTRFYGTVSVLVVEPSLEALVPAVTMLTGIGFHVTTAANFSQARALLDAQVPSLLVTAVRLGQYNGLHLVIRAKAVKPDVAALVTSETADRVLQADAEAMGATFIVKPITSKELAAAALRSVFASDTAPAAIRPPFERRTLERRRSLTGCVEERRVAERRRETLSPTNGAIASI